MAKVCTFVVLEMDGDGEPAVIAHVKTTADAIRITEDMRIMNPDRKFHWIMVSPVK